MFNDLIAILNILIYMSVIIKVDASKLTSKDNDCLKTSKIKNLHEINEWIEYESLIFVVTLVSIPMFLLFKTFVSQFLGGFRYRF